MPSTETLAQRCRFVLGGEETGVFFLSEEFEESSPRVAVPANAEYMLPHTHMFMVLPSLAVFP